MSKNYDNWERLVAAVMKRDQIWQLCHQDSISSSVFSDDSSLSFRFSDVKPLPLVPVSLEGLIISRAFKFAPQLREGDCGTTNIATLLQDVRVSDQKCFLKGSKAAIKILPETVKVTKHEFEQQMIVLGNCSHENVEQPLAYYFSEERKLLMVYDYCSQGSVFDMLHSDGSKPDWESRLRIAVGAARGLAHIHTKSGGKLVHGNIKSSNIFLNSQHYGCVSDFSLAAVRHPTFVGESVVMKNPFPTLWNHKPYQMNDVYSFGLLLLELVTRESPSNNIVDRLRDFYPQWEIKRYEKDLKWSVRHNHRSVESLDRNKKLLHVLKDRDKRFPFVDIDLNISRVHQDLHKMLQVAARCLERNAQNRLTMSNVVLMLQNIP